MGIVGWRIMENGKGKVFCCEGREVLEMEEERALGIIGWPTWWWCSWL